MDDIIKEIALTGGIIFWVFKEVFNFLKDKNKKKKDDPSVLLDHVNKNKDIYPILWKLLVKYGASRVVIFQFHNGTSYYSNNHIQRMTASHEVYDEDKALAISRSYTDIPITENMTDTLVHVSRTGYMHIDDVNKTKELSDKHKSTLKLYDVDSLLSVALRNKESQIVGILSLHFNEPDALSCDDVLEVRNLKSEIENVLNKF